MRGRMMNGEDEKGGGAERERETRVISKEKAMN